MKASETETPEPHQSWVADSINSLKGFCMGICDAVPGVSGGTVALIVGIYERLFIAISHIDRRLFNFIRKKEWVNAWNHVDARFLISLIIGLGVGYVTMSLAIKVLMADSTLRAITLAAFAGMVLGSVAIVFKRIRPEKNQLWVCVLFSLIGCAVSVTIACQNNAAATGEVNRVYLYCCTVVAICAMILPGISGAMLLLIFGVYYYVLDIPRNLIHLENVGTNLLDMGIVIAGCLTGLLLFGRLIKWLLQTYRAVTLSTMLGLMIGSLVVLWPFQHRIEPEVEHHKPTYEVFFPSEWSTLIPIVIGVTLLFSIAVYMTEWLATRLVKQKTEVAENA